MRKNPVKPNMKMLPPQRRVALKCLGGSCGYCFGGSHFVCCLMCF